MEQTKLVITSYVNEQEHLEHAALLLRGRWSCYVNLVGSDRPVLFVNFERFRISVRRIKAALGDLESCLSIQRINENLTSDEAIQMIELQEKYNVPTTLTYESDGEEAGTSSRHPFFQKQKRKKL